MVDSPIAAAPPASTRVSGGRVTLGAITTTVACVLPVFLIGGLAVQIRDELHLSPADIGLVVSMYFGVSALASVPAAAVVERLGTATAARVAIGMAGGGMLAVAVLAHDLVTLALLLVLSAGANSLGQIASNTALAGGVVAGRQGLSFGLKQAAIPVATLLSGAAVPAVALTVGWRWAFPCAATIALAALFLVTPDTTRTHRRGADARRVPAAATGDLLLIGAAAMLAAGAANALGTFLVDASVDRGIAAAMAGLTLTAGSVVCAGARVLGGWLADRRTGGHLGTVAFLLGVGALGLALIQVSAIPVMILGVLLGFGLGWSWPGLLNFAVVRLHPDRPAVATSITQTGVYAGGCLGPLAFGAIATGSGYPTAWVSAAASMLVASALMLVAARLTGAAGRSGAAGGLGAAGGSARPSGGPVRDEVA